MSLNHPLVSPLLLTVAALGSVSCVPESERYNDSEQGGAAGVTAVAEGGAAGAENPTGSAGSGGDGRSFDVISKQCDGDVSTYRLDAHPMPCADGSNLELEIDANGTDEYLFVLNVPDSWSSVVGGGGEFFINDVDETEEASLIAAGYYSSEVDQRIPLTIVGTRALTAGEHTIRAFWKGAGEAGSLTLGGSGARLMAIPARDEDLQSRAFDSNYGEDSPQLLHSSEYQNLALSYDAPIQMDSQTAGSYLLVFNTPVVWMDTGLAGFRIVVDRAEGDTEQLAYGAFTSATSNQRVPVTLVAMAELADGDSIRVEGAASDDEIVVATASLVALRAPHTALSSVRDIDGGEATTTSDTVARIPGIAPLEFTANEGDSLVILNVPVAHSEPGTTAGFHIGINDSWDYHGYTTSGTSLAQYVPMTIFAARELDGGGDYRVEAGWNVDHGSATVPTEAGLYVLGN